MWFFSAVHLDEIFNWSLKQLLNFKQHRFALIRAKLTNLHKSANFFVFFLWKIMLKCTYCYMSIFSFFGVSFVSNVFEFASLNVFIASLTRPGILECITRFNKSGLNKPFNSILKRCWVKYAVILLKVFRTQIVIPTLNTQYQHVNTWSTGLYFFQPIQHPLDQNFWFAL